MDNIIKCFEGLNIVNEKQFIFQKELLYKINVKYQVKNNGFSGIDNCGLRGFFIFLV